MFDKWFGKKASQQDSVLGIKPSAKTEERKPLRVYDKYGRELLITANDWLTKVLPGQIEQDWNEADKLYSIVVQALRDGFEKEDLIFRAARRLFELAPQEERGTTVYGIVLMKREQWDRARKLYEDFLQDHPSAAYVTTNLAKVYSGKGDPARAEQTLWKALTLDPNQENAVGWYAVLHRERGGEQAYLQALRRVAALPGSWYAKLLIARELLQDGDKDEAMPIYRELVAHHPDNSTVLTSISGELGKAKMYDAIFRLVAPVYDSEKHGPVVGVNLLQAYLETGDFRRGEPFLQRMYALQRPDFKQHLDFYSHKFAELKRDNAASGTMDVTELKIVAVSLDRPIWYYSLGDPTWLLPGKSDDIRVLCFALANTSKNLPEVPVAQQTNEIGRISRGVPLWLSESITQSSVATGAALILTAKGKGVVLSGKDSTPQDIARFAAENAPTRFAVTGEIAEEPGQYQVTLRLWNAETASLIEEFAETAPTAKVGGALERLKARLFTRMQLPAGKQESLVRIPSLDVAGRYLAALEQSLSLLLAERDVVPASTLWGERDMLNYFLNMAVQQKDNQPARLMLVSGLERNRRYGSGIHQEFSKPALALLEDDGPASLLGRLSPLLYRCLGMYSQFDEKYREAAASADSEYRRWVEGLQKEPE